VPLLSFWGSVARGAAFVILVSVILPCLPGTALAQDVRVAKDQIELTLPQARQLAAQALAAGRPDLAVQLASGLLAADPESSYAHFVLANAYAQQGRSRTARKSASRAYRYADTPSHRFEAAELAARISYVEKRPTLTQLWLRRAAHYAPDAQVEEQLGKDFARVRAENPLYFSLRGGIRPSSNVNNGADTAFQIIDGIPFVGTLSGRARALSGVILNFDGILRYRLRGSARSRTDLTSRLYVQRVLLDGNSKERAPEVSNSDFGTTYAEVGLRHAFAIGEEGDSGILDFALGQYWTGGRKNYSFGRLSGERRWQLTPQTEFIVDASIERRLSAFRARFDSTAYGLVMSARHKLKSGDGLFLSLNLRKTDSRFVNSRVNTAAVQASYNFGEQIGPVFVSAGMVLGYSDYPDFIALFEVPGGRQDKSAYADVNLFFPDIDYGGFAPTLRIRAGRKYSNVSRYDTRELSVSLGIQSKF